MEGRGGDLGGAAVVERCEAGRDELYW